MNDFFRRQLASYASVHRSGRNKATHFVGIPIIVFSLLLIMVPTWYAAEALAGALGASSTWVAFAVLFIGGWALQFLGHHYEGKRPALVDNIFQAFVGPMFLVAETLVASGYRADLADLMGE